MSFDFFQKLRESVLVFRRALILSESVLREISLRRNAPFQIFDVFFDGVDEALKCPAAENDNVTAR